MNKKPTGLINTEMVETPADRAERESRDAYIDNWGKENLGMAQVLKKLSKDQLIHLVIRAMAGRVYDKGQSKITTADYDSAEFEALMILGFQLRKGSPEEQHAALAKWEAEMIAGAGNNTLKVAKIARMSGATKVRIDERPKIEAYKAREVNLAIGRKDGVKKRQKTADEKQALLIKAIAALFDNDNKPGWVWSNPDIVNFLKKGNYGYADSVILQTVKQEAAKYRKSRKEQLASKFPDR